MPLAPSTPRGSPLSDPQSTAAGPDAARPTSTVVCNAKIRSRSDAPRPGARLSASSRGRRTGRQKRSWPDLTRRPRRPASRTGRTEKGTDDEMSSRACGAGQRPTRRGSCTWERRTLPVPAPVFRVIPRFSDIRQDESTCSHVHRPPCAHMGAHQSISTIRAEPRNLNEKRRPPHRAPFLPCANHPCSTGRAPREPISSRK